MGRVVKVALEEQPGAASSQAERSAPAVSSVEYIYGDDAGPGAAYQRPSAPVGVGERAAAAARLAPPSAAPPSS